MCIVGVGGVGSWVVEALARSGVGALTLIDMDDVCITNTNRQLPAMAQTLGHMKVSVLEKRVLEINPECRVTAVTEFLLESNVERLLAPEFDCLIDAVDSTPIKALLIAKARALGKPIVVSGSAGGRRDPTQIKVADLGQAGGDPLIQQVRKKLRDVHGFSKSTDGRALLWQVPCVYSTEKAMYPQPDGTCSLEKAQDVEVGLRLDCSAGFGAATFVTGGFGFAIAAEVIKAILAEQEG